MKGFSAGIVSTLLALTFLFLRGGYPVASAATVQATRPSAASAACPLQTPEAWQSFLERYAENEKWVETCEDSACDEEYFAFVRHNIRRVLDTCAAFIAEHPAIESCTRHYREFVPTWMRMHDEGSYGFNVPNHEYLARQERPDRPAGMMQPPEAIVRALPDRSKVEEAARLAGYKYLTHDSGIDGIRTFVFNPDPHGRFDQWLLLNLKAGDTSVNSSTPLSVLTVQKRDAAGNPLKKVRLHFRDWTIEHSGAGYRLTLNEEGNGKCYSCHTNGVRQLIPRRTPTLEAKPSRGEPGFDEAGSGPPLPDFAYGRLMEFNRRLRAYGAPDWEGMVTPENHGPVLGEAQGCTDCHDGKSRATLNVSTSTTQIEKRIHDDLSMPYDTDLPRLLERHQMKNPKLTPDEERALREAFAAHGAMTDDYLGARAPALRDWLLETPCGS